MLEYDWENSVGYWVCSASQAMRKQLGTLFLKEGITFRQWEVLCWMSATGGCGSQSELAEALGIEPHTMAGVVSRMQRDGLLERKCCDQDRRKNRISPTREAEELWRRASRVAQVFREQAISDFTQEELLQLRGFCERIRHNLGDTVSLASNRTFHGRFPTSEDSLEIQMDDALEPIVELRS
ncbi:MAG TPA: MarR family transcriptional regulator [Planctomicrobium sp.]|nr:MarR family transcriptional regulator [Planctomicrobium sp.]